MAHYPLDVYRRTTGLHRDFGVFYEKWLYKRLAHPAFAFLHEAFETYLGKHYTGGEVTKRLQPFKGKPAKQLQERPYLTKAQTKVTMGIGEDVLQVLLAQGSLRYLKKPIGRAGKRTMFLIERGSVETVQREWAGLLPLDAVARSYLGVTKGVLLRLEQVRLLVPVRGPFVDGYKFRLYSPADIEQLEKALLLHSIKVSEWSTDFVSLPKFSAIVGMPLVDLLKEIFEGRFTLVETDVHQPLLQRLVLSRAEIPSFLKEFKQRRCETLGFLTTHQVALELGISERVLKRWTQSGLLEGKKLAIDGKKATLLYQKEALDTFHATYVFMEEAAQRLGVMPCTVRKYMRKGILHPIVGRSICDGGNRLLFLRQEVESLLQPESLTVDEAVELLGMSRSRVYGLIRRGELPSVRQSVRGSKNGKICLLSSDVEAYRQRIVDLAQGDRLPGKETQKDPLAGEPKM